eukprot:3123029-Pyramimonas_sp.AAC.1
MQHSKIHWTFRSDTRLPSSQRDVVGFWGGPILFVTPTVACCGAGPPVNPGVEMAAGRITWG